jgi:hypothetical protein
MNRTIGYLVLTALGTSALSGCTRVYSVYQDRQDQDLNVGNRGYIKGDVAPIAQADVPKVERKVFEIEVPFMARKKKVQPPPAVAAGTGAEDAGAALVEPAMAEDAPLVPGKETLVDYTVVANDTLQKISKKFYGSTRYWKRIFRANEAELMSPDRIKPGQVLKVPMAVTAAPAVEPEENLK